MHNIPAFATTKTIGQKLISPDRPREFSTPLTDWRQQMAEGEGKEDINDIIEQSLEEEVARASNEERDPQAVVSELGNASECSVIVSSFTVLIGSHFFKTHSITPCLKFNSVYKVIQYNYVFYGCMSIN